MEAGVVAMEVALPYHWEIALVVVMMVLAEAVAGLRAMRLRMKRAVLEVEMVMEVMEVAIGIVVTRPAFFCILKRDDSSVKLMRSFMSAALEVYSYVTFPLIGADGTTTDHKAFQRLGVER